MENISREKRKDSSTVVSHAELFEIKEMLGFIMHTQETNKYEMDEEFWEMEYKINSKVDNLSCKIDKLHSLVEGLDSQVWSLQTTLEEDKEHEPLEDSCHFLEGSNENIIVGKVLQFADLEIIEDIVYDEFEDCEDLLIHDGGFSFGVIVGTAPKRKSKLNMNTSLRL